MITDSNRTQDEFGYLTVENCILTGEDVAKYFGHEIPYCKQLGLDEKKVYNVYRPIEEIRDSNFSNKPLLSKHADFSAEDYKYKLIVGTVGETTMEGDQTKGTVVFWDKKAIEELERGKKFLSCGYLYDPIMEKGFYNNSSYDIKMSNIVANHVAMVDNPRYKPAIVADEELKTDEKGKSMFFNKKKTSANDEKVEWNFDSAIKNCMDAAMSDEEKEEKLKEIKEKMTEKAKAKDKKDECMEKKEKEQGGIEDEELEDEEQEENQEELMGKKKKKMTGDKGINIQKLVADSVALEMDRFHKKNLAFDAALREYERICGKVNRIAFDSAEKVLDTILKNNKRSFEGKSLEQKQAMVEMLPSQRANTNVQATLTIDSTSSSKNHTPSNILNFLKGKL